MALLHIFITVGIKANGQFEVLVFPEDDTPRKRRVHVKRGDRVHWTVLNTTDEEVKVKVDLFRPNGTDKDNYDALEDPMLFASPNGPQEVTVVAAHNNNPSTGLLKGEVRGMDKLGAYEYDVYVEDICVTDPMLRVDS